MKKTTIVALLLVLVVGFGFASNSRVIPYSEEEYKVTTDYVFNLKNDAHWFMPAAEADLRFGMKNESVDFAGTVEANALVDRAKNFPTVGEDVILPSFEVRPGFDVDLKLGTFTGSFDGQFISSLERWYCLDDSSKYQTNGIGFVLNTDADWVIPMQKRNAFFDIYTNGGIGFSKETDIDFDDTEASFVKSFGADFNTGVGFYFPRQDFLKDFSREYFFDLASKDEYDIANDYSFFVNLDARIDFLKSSYGKYVEHIFVLDGAYNLAFNGLRNNVMSFKQTLTENLENYYGSKSNEFTIDNSMRYFLKLNKGVNAIDYFQLVTNLKTAMTLAMYNGKTQPINFDIVVDGDVYLPRIIPVEMLPNFSLALPTDIYFSFETAFDNMKETATAFAVSYKAKVTPFYVEIKKPVKFLDMYLNTARLDVEFFDTYAWTTASKAVSSERTLDTTFVIGMDKGNNVVDSSSLIKLEYERDFSLKLNFVTIALDAKF